MKQIIMGILGVILLTGVLITAEYGLSEENIEVYEEAIDLQTKINGVGFDGFYITDYPMAFYDGEKDYVITREGTDYTITKRKALVDFIAATAYPVDGQFEIHTPTVEKMSSLVGMLGVLEGAEYGKNNHIVTLWHEAFHCYQLTNYMTNIEAFCETAVEENKIAETVDVNEQAVELYKQQATLLKEAVKCEEIDKIREYIVQYKELEDKRNLLLEEEAINLERYYTTVEGSACYIEANVCKELEPERFEADYVNTIGDYANGTAKYYKAGMAQCMILDRIAPGWKNGYDFSKVPIELIYEILGI
ncbi:MAG: hypothetical protein IKK33_15125 [Lachnospiraceae bacterium]|nr:hypothetical protein [Lachnospiraceae bacterium]